MKTENNRFELLEQITALDFMVEDLQLYLDTHPTDRNALAKYNSVIPQLKMLEQKYSRMFGPLTEHDSQSAYPWQWICEPWPWEYEANFRIASKER